MSKGNYFVGVVAQGKQKQWLRRRCLVKRHAAVASSQAPRLQGPR